MPMIGGNRDVTVHASHHLQSPSLVPYSIHSSANFTLAPSVACITPAREESHFSCPSPAREEARLRSRRETESWTGGMTDEEGETVTRPSESVNLVEEEVVLLLEPSEELPPKVRIPWGYLPRTSEVVPPGCAASLAAVAAGMLSGLRVCLTTAGYASVIFAMSDNESVAALYPMGVHVLWFSACFGIVWNGLFGRLQYSIADIQGALAMQLCDVVRVVCEDVHPDRVEATVWVTLSLTALSVGVVFVVAGSLGFGNFMLQFPISATCGFLASVGWSLTRAGLMLSTQANFHMFYPTDWNTGPGGVFRTDALIQLGAAVGLVLSMRFLPRLLKGVTPHRYGELYRLYPAVATLAPLGVFYIALTLSGYSMGELRDRGWFYKSPDAHKPLGWIRERNVSQADWGAISRYGVLMRVLVLDVVALVSSPIALMGISDTFACSPHLPGDPSPLEPADPDVELRSLGLSGIITAGFGGIPTYHSLGNSVATRLEGGTHRLSSYVASLFLFILCMAAVPMQSCVPKFFLAGILLNIGFIFLKQGLIDARRVLPLKEFLIIVACLVVQLYTAQLVESLTVGILFAVALFVYQVSQPSPLAAASVGQRSSVCRTKWEAEALETASQQVLTLRLSGVLFFGSASGMSKSVMRAMETCEGQDVRFIVLDFSGVGYVDASAAKGFGALRQRLEAAGKELLFCSCCPDVGCHLRKAGAVSEEELHGDCDHALEACEDALLADVLAPEKRLSSERFFKDALNLSDEEIDSLRARARTRVCEPGQQVIPHCSPPSDLVIVRSGSVDIFTPKIGDDCLTTIKPQKVVVAGRSRRAKAQCGGFVGHDAFIAEVPHKGDAAVSMQEKSAELWSISRKQWESMKTEEPKLHAKLLEKMMVSMAMSSVTGATGGLMYRGA
eukprot:Hpha_TRINITY_DN16485_c2_g7::TRINITY_DN16485_c2_g7_i1::g.160450::m.160450/K03321/TC.SULP; sulfate permease, SulP family